MQFLWWTTTKQMNMSSFFFQVNNHDSKNDIYNGIQNSNNIKMWAKHINKRPMGYIAHLRVQMIIIMLI